MMSETEEDPSGQWLFVYHKFVTSHDKDMFAYFTASICCEVQIGRNAPAKLFSRR